MLFGTILLYLRSNAFQPFLKAAGTDNKTTD